MGAFLFRTGCVLSHFLFAACSNLCIVVHSSCFSRPPSVAAAPPSVASVRCLRLSLLPSIVCAMRFTTAGDKVLVSAFEHNPLATHILAGGRRLCALVETPDKASTVEKQVKGALAAAMAAGWFKELAHAGVPLGGSVLPAGFPPHNMSQASQDDIQRLRAIYDVDDDSGGWNLDVAKEIAEQFGFEIKVSASMPAPAFRMLC